MKRIGMLAALALILSVNAIVLAGVHFNRSGEPDATLTLTERELHLVSNEKEKSGVSLKLELQSDSEVSPWFDRKKLEEVGFDCSTPVGTSDASSRYEKVLPRKAYVVLEFEGRAWETWLAGRRAQLRKLETKVAKGNDEKKELDSERKSHRWEMAYGSRLFAVDVGNDAAKLRQRYPDHSRYIITPALVRLRLLRDEVEKKRKPELSGSVEEILTDRIHVPRDLRGILTSLSPDGQYFYHEGVKENFLPRYRVRLNYGRRYEPWVAMVITK